LGRKGAEGFIPHWENVANNPADPEFGWVLNIQQPLKLFLPKHLRSLSEIIPV